MTQCATIHYSNWSKLKCKHLSFPVQFSEICSSDNIFLLREREGNPAMAAKHQLHAKD